MEIEVGHHDNPDELAQSIKRRFGHLGVGISEIQERKIRLKIDEEMPDHMSESDVILVARAIEEDYEWVQGCKIHP